MKEVTSLLIALLALYLLIGVFLYLFQRSLIYFPVPLDPYFEAEEIAVDSADATLRGWVLNPGKPGAVIYFGGNSERISDNREDFEAIFPNHSVYLVNYRGYGASGGKPSEAALFADALAIHDLIASRHESVSALGRSLGSGIAVYLATQRTLEWLALLTPYDSITAVAQRAYPIYPAGFLLKDHFASDTRAAALSLPVLIVVAQRDRVVPPAHAEALRRALVNAKVRYVVVDGASHNDVTAYPAFREALRAFIDE